MRSNLLKNWNIRQTWNGDFYLVGTIYHDAKERFEDGAEIHTSTLRKIDFVNGIAETRNTTYTLERRIPL